MLPLCVRTFLYAACVVWLLAACCPFVDCASVRDGIHPINIASSTVAATLMRQATAAYAVENEFNAIVTPYASNAALLPVHLSGTADLTLTTTGFSTSQLQATPQHYHFPVIASAIVPIYNLPTSAGATQLMLPLQVICDIERGNLTNWNDPRIQSVNPDLVLPNLGITVLHLSIAAAASDGITGACGKLDPVFKAQIPRAQNPAWATSKYFAYGTGSNSDVLASMVVDTVGAFAMATYQNVVAVKAKVAAVRNYAGVVLQPTINAISLNILEMAVDPIPTGSSLHDLAGPLSPNAWPICTLVYLLIDLVNPVTTCATKTLMLKFVLWFFSSSSVKLLAESLNMAVVPDLFTTETDLITDLQTRVTCQGSKLVTSSQDKSFIEGFQAGGQLLGAFFNYYKAIDSKRTYEFHATTERLATQRVVASEIDLALVNTVQLAQSDTDLMNTQAGGGYVPAFFTGVAVTFALPTAISSKWSTWTATSGLPALYPLALDLETVAQIFTGQITSWLHPRILATSPQLSNWFTTYPTANPIFQVLVCCSLTSEQPVAGLLLMQNLNRTSTAKNGTYASMFATPLAWTEQLKPTTTAFTLLDLESRVTPKSTSLATIGSSTISYRLVTNAATDTTSEFQIVQYVDGVKETVAPQPSNYRPCAQAGWDAGTMHLTTFALSEPVKSCYPLSSPMAFGTNLIYTGTQCERGNKSLNLFNWIATTDSLSEAALNAGAFRIADIPACRDATVNFLNSATCDGKTLLITLPQVWKVNQAISGFGWANLAVGCLLFLITGILLFVYRKRTVLRSSSVPFLAITLVGLTMLIISVAAWTSDVSDASCGSFMWLAPLGFSLVFVPFFAKTYRIWAIFSRKQLKVIKMSNKKLMAGVIGVILAEMVLLIVWSQFDPLKPIEYLRNVSGRMHQATHCSVEGNGMTFVVIEAVYKGLLLVAGTMLAFSTRKVSSAFNESSAIAWSIYNVLFSSVIVGAIVYFVDAFEDTLILLFVFLIAWVVFVTWALLFGAKFHALFSQSEADAALASKVDSLRTEKSGGFSFVSVVSMPIGMLKTYIVALEGQIGKAKKQLTIALGTNGQGLGIGIGNKLRTQTQQQQSPTSPKKYLSNENVSLPGQVSGLGNEPEDGSINQRSITGGGNGGGNVDELERDILFRERSEMNLQQQQQHQQPHQHPSQQPHAPPSSGLPPGLEVYSHHPLMPRAASVTATAGADGSTPPTPSGFRTTTTTTNNFGFNGGPPPRSNGGKTSPSLDLQRRLVINAYTSQSQQPPLTPSPSPPPALSRSDSTHRLPSSPSNETVIEEPTLAASTSLNIITPPSNSPSSSPPPILTAIDETNTNDNVNVNVINTQTTTPIVLSPTANLSTASRPSSRATHQIMASTLKE